MSNLVKLVRVETKVTLDTDAREAIEGEIKTLNYDTRIDVRSSANVRLYKIIDNCLTAAYRLGKIDAEENYQ